ncbi:hypothetical protein ACOMHN_066451 [Nucella lapillus]
MKRQNKTDRQKTRQTHRQRQKVVVVAHSHPECSPSILMIQTQIIAFSGEMNGHSDQQFPFHPDHLTSWGIGSGEDMADILDRGQPPVLLWWALWSLAIHRGQGLG